MRPLRTDEDVLELAKANAPTVACARNIAEGRATVERDEPNFGWRVTVRNVSNGRTWTIGIYLNSVERKYVVRYL